MFQLTALLLAATISSTIPGGQVKDTQITAEQFNNNKLIVKQIDGDIRNIKKELEKLQLIISDKNQCQNIIIKPGNNGNKPSIIWPGNNGNNSSENQPDSEFPPTELPEDKEEISDMAQKIADLVNAERAKEGLKPLTLKVDISKAAQLRSKEIETSFSHTRPNGSSFSSILKENGISFRGAGENIAWGQKSAEAVMKAWMNSSGHRANILNKNYTKIGVGYYVNSAGTPYWTQLFTY